MPPCNQAVYGVLSNSSEITRQFVRTQVPENAIVRAHLISRSFEKGQTMDAGKSRKADHTGKLGRETTFDKAALDAARRWKRLDLDQARAELFHQRARDNAATYRRNIESYIGTVDIPVGLAGPLRINGRNGTVIYQVPLATTEAALVASYQRGSRLITAAGGCDVRVLDQGVSRAPMFAFGTPFRIEQYAC